MRLIAFPQWDKLTSFLRGMARQSAARREGVPHQRLHRNGTDIRPIFKLVPVVSPPHTFSKLRLINALMSNNLWPTVRDWRDASGYYDLFVAQPLAAPSGFALRAQATRPLRGGYIAKTSAKTTRSSPPPASASLSPNPKSPPFSPRVPPTNYSQTSL
jgi:hypothetical protein